MPQIAVSTTNIILLKLFFVLGFEADLIHNFGSGMPVLSEAEVKCSFPGHRKGLTEWKAEIGDCVQDICSEALFPK